MIDLAGADASPLPAPGAGDPLAAFLDALHGPSSRADSDVPAAAAAGPPETLLSNGLNADAGVAQLVSALASLPDMRSAFDAAPFTAPTGDPSLHGVVAPAT